MELLKGRGGRRKLANNTYLQYEGDEKGAYVIRLHGHPIMKFYEDGRIYLGDCGWRTYTTKERINRFLPRGWSLYQRNWEWFLQWERPLCSIGYPAVEYKYNNVEYIRADGAVKLVKGRE
jgi:hypothetical protein